jgi:hypothetical protein
LIIINIGFQCDFIIFALMKWTVRQTFFLFFAISFTISLVDCVLDDYVSFHEQITSNRECSDLPCQSDDAHLNHLDDVFYSVSRIHSNNNLNQQELIDTISVDLKSNYLTSIWQPPKRA